MINATGLHAFRYDWSPRATLSEIPLSPLSLGAVISRPKFTLFECLKSVDFKQSNRAPKLLAALTRSMRRAFSLAHVG
jgi:hypothetical protein